MAKIIDINCDIGEGFGNEALLMPYISSCNIACGGHAGDEATMTAAVELANAYSVKIGAHPSFPDRENFGRKSLKITSNELYQTIYKQIECLNNILLKRNLVLNHIKPHGALYNLAAVDEKIADVIVDVVKSFRKNLILYVPYQSVIATKAINNRLTIKYEAFADRHYNSDLTLVSRDHEYALIQNPDDMFNHVYEMLVNGKVNTIDGGGKTIKADTFCIHGDGKNVVHNIKVLEQKLNQHHIKIR